MANEELKCPRCDVAMASMTMVGVHIDVCSNCNGCWLDNKEIELMTRSRGKNALTVELANKKDSYAFCPRCREKTLQEGNHVMKPSLLLDECKNCHGVWLDRGELPTLLTLRKEIKP